MTQDLTLDEIRSLLAPGIAANAAFDGWSDAARDMAADAAGIDRDVAALAFEQGPVDMIDAWFAHIDAAMLDNTVSGQFVSDNPRLKLAREFDTGEQYGMAVKKDGNIPLLRQVNGVLADLRQDGSYDKIYGTYFG